MRILAGEFLCIRACVRMRRAIRITLKPKSLSWTPLTTSARQYRSHSRNAAICAPATFGPDAGCRSSFRCASLSRNASPADWLDAVGAEKISATPIKHSEPACSDHFRCGNCVAIRSRWQFCPGLLRYHVSGVPVGPVRVALPGALLVLAVGGLRTPKRARQITC